MSAAYSPSLYSTGGTSCQGSAKPKASAAAKRRRPVQLSIFDYAASLGITLLPEAQS
jgi:hypothetical protein